MAEVVLALGSNLGDRLAYLSEAVAQLEAEGFPLMKRSSLWETDPVPADQPEFLNAVVAVRAPDDIEPGALLGTVKQIEQRIGRTPTSRWGPRVIDIDILFIGTVVVDQPNLAIPHPRISERPFVLVPLEEILDGPLPHLGATPRELLDALPPGGIRKSSMTW